MTTSMNEKDSVQLTIANVPVQCKDFNISKDKHAITISMTIQNIGTKQLLLSVNNLCLVNDGDDFYTQHCYINDGNSFEVISGWTTIMPSRSYTLITKYLINPNLTTYHLYYKTVNQVHSIISLKG